MSDIYQIPIKELPEDERPREKLIKYGPGLLKDSELLAIILNTGFKGLGVLELTQLIFKL